MHNPRQWKYTGILFMHSPQKRHLFSLRHRRAIILSLALTALLYLTAVTVSGYAAAWQAISRLDAASWLILLLCSFSNYLLRFIRWQSYLRRAGWRLPPGLHLTYYLAGFALTTSPGKAGETIRSLLLRPHGVPYPTSLACFFSERLLDVIVIALLAGLTAFSFTEHRLFVVVVLLLTLGLIPFVHSRVLLRLISAITDFVTSSRIKSFLAHTHHLLQDARTFLAIRSLYQGLLLGLFAWSLQGFAFHFLLSELGFHMSLTMATGIYAISLLAGALSMIPGGIGTTEAAMALLLGAAGAQPQVALIAPLINRLTTLWFAVAVGMLASSWLARQRRLPENA
jgi:uncharacterized protein (TIRG00374 family)